MSQLLKWDRSIPDRFYSTVTHLWILLDDGTVAVAKKNHSVGGIREDTPHVSGADEEGRVHEEVWGSSVWSNEKRGYYSHEHGLVTCHGDSSPELRNKLARKFKEAIYYS